MAKLGAVERAAGRIFATVGMADVAAHEPLPPAELAGYQRGGRAWVAVDGDDRPVAYVLVDVVDGGAHIEQLSVHPDAGRQGIGARLVDTVAEWAVASELDRLTLITFRDVAWNRPYYERLGFRVLPDDRLGPGLAARRRAEPASGLDPTQRVCMYRPVGSGVGRDEDGARNGTPSSEPGWVAGTRPSL